MVLEFDNCYLSPTSPASSNKNELYIFHHIWRLEDAIERSETNPGRSLGDSDNIKNLCLKGNTFFNEFKQERVIYFIIFGVWKTLLSEARVTRDEVSGIATTSKNLPERQYIFRKSAFLNVRRLLPYLKTMHRVGKLIFYVESALSADSL